MNDFDPFDDLELIPVGTKGVQLDASCSPPEDRGLEIERILAQGGMGMIREARDPWLGRTMVLKVLQSHARKNKRLRSRLLAEAQLTAQLDHPNIVPVYELGISKKTGLYFSMKKVEGKTLTEVLRSSPLSGRDSSDLFELLDIFLKVCDAVAFAHDRGVLHRDIKADNVMVGRFGQVYLMDWGIARVLGQDIPPGEGKGDPRLSGRLTQEGKVVGTLNYMAPEQIRDEELDQRTDIFALGGLLYEILTNEAPYPDGPVDEMIRKARDGKIDPPDRRSGISLPPRLCSIAMKALAPRKKDRYSSVDQLRNVVKQFLQSGWQFPIRRFSTGTTIFREGDPGTVAYAIYSGRCRVTQGSEKRELRILERGDVFGETAVFAKTPRSATVTAIEDSVLVEISRESFEEELGMGFWLGLFVKALAQRFLQKEEELRKIREEMNSGE